MRVTVQVLLHADDDTRTVLREAFTLNREVLAPDTVGLQLQEAKDLLAAVQHTVVEHQVTAALSALLACPDCGIPRRHKDSRRIVMRTLFGTLRLDSPRWWACPCTPGTARTFSPLAAILRERTTPELSYLQARFAGRVSYGGVRRPARRGPAAGPGAARHHGAPAGAGHRATPGGRARRRKAGLHHRVPGRLGGTAPPGPAVGRRPGRRLRPLLHRSGPAGTAGSR